MAKVVFGADGIRGNYGEWPFELPALQHIGQAIGQFVSARSPAPVVVLGRDTRLSGQEIATCLMTGMLSQGVNVINLGVMTTPGVAYLTRRQGADLGLAVTASHSPYYMNGIKLIAPSGLRFDHEEELYIEDLIDQAMREPNKDVAAVGRVVDGNHLFQTYAWDHITTCSPDLLQGLRLVLDCAEGAAARVAPRVMRELGAEVSAIYDRMDGSRINLNCGSEYARSHPEHLAEKARERGASYAFAFDGDGDRLVVVDRQGNAFDGHDLMYLLARDFHSKGKLRKNTIVTTHQASRGLKRALLPPGIHTYETNNGDHNLELALYGNGFSLAGEPGGNIIINDGAHTAADGIFTAILVGEVLNQERDTPLIERVAPLRAMLAECHQAQRAARIHAPLTEHQHRTLRDCCVEIEARLGDDCRALFWPSSTEPGLVRVMVEGCSGILNAEVEQAADELRDLILDFNRGGGG